MAFTSLCCLAEGLYHVRELGCVLFDPSDPELIVCAVEPRLWVLVPEIAQFDRYGEYFPHLVDVSATSRRGQRVRCQGFLFARVHGLLHDCPEVFSLDLEGHLFLLCILDLGAAWRCLFFSDQKVFEKVQFEPLNIGVTNEEAKE